MTYWFEGSSGGLRRGIKLVLLAGNTSYGLQLVLGSAIFRDAVAELRRKGCNRSQSKNLLRCEGNADKRSAGDDLKKGNGVRAEIEKAVMDAYAVKVQDLGADGS